MSTYEIAYIKKISKKVVFQNVMRIRSSNLEITSRTFFLSTTDPLMRVGFIKHIILNTLAPYRVELKPAKIRLYGLHVWNCTWRILSLIMMIINLLTILV